MSALMIRMILSAGRTDIQTHLIDSFLQGDVKTMKIEISVQVQNEHRDG